MAEYQLVPKIERHELIRASGLVLKHKKSLGLKTNREVAEIIGMTEGELSKFLSGRAYGSFGFKRLSRIADWVRVGVDELLGRPPDTTKVVLARAGRPEAMPVILARNIILRPDELSRAMHEEAWAYAEFVDGLREDLGDATEKVIPKIQEYLKTATERRLALSRTPISKHAASPEREEPARLR